MSRIAAVLSRAGAPHEHRSKLVGRMLRAMPGATPAHVHAGNASAAWSGTSGGGAHAAGGVCAVMDGEVFNARELGASLSAPPGNDAQLVVELYRRHGFPETLARLNGDFAIVLSDERSGRVWLARDRAGLKPMYFAETGEWFACASQPAGLLVVPGIEASIDRRYAALIAGSHYRTFDNAPDRAPFSTMRQLPAAHFAEISDGGVRVGSYWKLEDSTASGTESELAEQYRELLLEAVGRRVWRSEKPVFTLSGGMDSSSVLCCAAELTGARQHAVSSVYADPTFDERVEIQDVVREKVERWRAVEIADDIDVIGQVASLVQIHNEPVATATWLSHNLVARSVASEGFDAVFGGLGGDELNAGEYEYFPLFFADLQAAGETELLEREIERWARYHDHPIYRKDREAASAMMARLTVPGSNGICRPNLDRQRQYAHVVRKDFHDLDSFEPEMEHPFSSFLRNRAYQDLTRETTPCCLRAEDRQTAAWGLRHYDPFLDHTLIEFMFRIPGTMKIRAGITKFLLRDAMRGIVPDATRERIKKTGWNAPAHVWFSGPDLERVRDIVRSRRFGDRGIYDVSAVEVILDDHAAVVASGAARENHMMFIWQLVNLDAWLTWIETGCPGAFDHDLRG